MSVLNRRHLTLWLATAGSAISSSPWVHAQGGSAPARGAGGYARHARAAAFIDAAVTQHELDRGWVLRQLGRAQRVEPVRRLIMPTPAGTARNWVAYRNRFIEPQRIGAGLAFARRESAWLQQTEARYGVPPHIVLGIIGVETFFGRIMGRFRVLDALATLAFDFPSGRSDRSGFFADELAHFLAWCRREDRDPPTLLGSFAGAMGLPQFMPSSINRYAVDGDGDGHIDLHASAADAIASVAHYLQRFGWQPGLPTHYTVQAPTDPAALSHLREPDILPRFSAQAMRDLGAQLDPAAQNHTGPLALVELENGDAPRSHVAGTENFYVITRYNRSAYYAMAVIELAEALKPPWARGSRG